MSATRSTGARVVYRLSVWISQPVSADDDDPDYYTPESAKSRPRQTEIERDVIRVLRAAKFGLDVDEAEIQDVAIEGVLDDTRANDFEDTGGPDWT